MWKLSLLDTRALTRQTHGANAFHVADALRPIYLSSLWMGNLKDVEGNKDLQNVKD